MPRKRVCPPPGDAVASSPLFRLSPEVRNIIYTYVLVDSDSYHALFIPIDFFKRRKNEPAYRCGTCRQAFDDHRQFTRHQSHYSNGEPCKPPTHKLPAISTDLLRSCRLINTEAASLLYRGNVFYFNVPHTLHQFRWKTAAYSKHSAWVEQLTLELSNSHVRAKSTVSWPQYLSGAPGKKTMWLSDDFPHLKRLTIVLTHGCLLYDFPALQEICDLLGQNIAGLGWVHIVGLNNEDVVSSLKPMAEPEKLLIMDHGRRYALQKEQNTRLLRMAELQAHHKPEDVAVQQELGDLRMVVLSQKLQSDSISRLPWTVIVYPTSQLQSYQMQLMLLEQQNIKRLLMARGEQLPRRESLRNLQDQHREQEDMLRLGEIWARHASTSCFSWSQELSKTEDLIRQLAVQIEEERSRIESLESVT
ncbi:MAG: hypothetical protein L6R40_006755 [Gallowayella cf. fulva]|nr:MAG: hypothetical protein L6R40_006755 [Xanthomendoza cf. fulva]